MLLQNELYKQICDWADAHAEEMYSDLADFARIKSVSRADLAQEGAPFGPDCRKMLDHALETAKKYGFETCDNEGYYGDAWIGDRSKAVGIIGHLDVVPEGDGWKYPPYSSTREGDFMIGRGTGDNKSACVAALYIMRMMRDIDAPLTNGVRAIFGCSEETGMNDMKKLVENEAQPPISLVPDSAFPVNYAQKGTMRGSMSIKAGGDIVYFKGGEVRNMVPPHAECEVRLPIEKLAPIYDGRPEFTLEATEAGCRIKAKGQAAHAASPSGGISAIYLLASSLYDSGLLCDDSAAAVNAVAQMCSDYTGAKAGIDCTDPESGATTMVCGVASTVNGVITLSLDCRLSIAADLKANEASFTAYAHSLGMEVSDLETGKPFYIPKDDIRIQLLSKVCEEVLGMENTEPYTMGGGTYSRVVPGAITFGLGMRASGEHMETAPGHGGAHQPDEYVYLPNIKEALKALACAVILLDRLI